MTETQQTTMDAKVTAELWRQDLFELEGQLQLLMYALYVLQVMSRMVHLLLINELKFVGMDYYMETKYEMTGILTMEMDAAATEKQ